jgi:hypothetical protein
MRVYAAAVDLHNLSGFETPERLSELQDSSVTLAELKSLVVSTTKIVIPYLISSDVDPPSLEAALSRWNKAIGDIPYLLK